MEALAGSGPPGSDFDGWVLLSQDTGKATAALLTGSHHLPTAVVYRACTGSARLWGERDVGRLGKIISCNCNVCHTPAARGFGYCASSIPKLSLAKPHAPLVGDRWLAADSGLACVAFACNVSHFVIDLPYAASLIGCDAGTDGALAKVSQQRRSAAIEQVSRLRQRVQLDLPVGKLFPEHCQPRSRQIGALVENDRFPLPMPAL